MRRTLRSLMLHLLARWRWLGKQKPRSSVSSARAIRTNFGAGGKRTVHAQVMTLRLIASIPPYLSPWLSSAALEQSTDGYALLPHVVGANGKEPAAADHRRWRQAVIATPQSIANGPWPNT